MEADNNIVIVIAKGTIQECITRAEQGLYSNKKVVVLGKSNTINKAISIVEIIKRSKQNLS